MTTDLSLRALRGHGGYSRAPRMPGHQILNHEGKVIPVTRRTIKALDSMRALFWNRAEKKHQIRAEMAAFLREWILQPDFRPRPLRAHSLEPRGRRGLPTNLLLLELGPDLSGCDGPVECRCRSCQRIIEDADMTHIPWDVANRVHAQKGAA